MIIQCDKCQTKFRLDDAKVKDDGVKVRCAKCRNVFRVGREFTEPEQRADFGALLDESVTSSVDASALTVEPEKVTAAPLPDEAPEPAPEKTPELAASEPAGEDLFGDSLAFDTAAFDSPNEEVSEQTAFDDFSFSSLPKEAEETLGGRQIDFKTDEPDEVDFGSFDFGEASAPVENHGGVASSFDFGGSQATKVSVAAPAVPEKKEFGGLDFSDDDMFGEVAAQVPEEPAESIAFDLGVDSFADAMSIDDGFGSQKSSLGTTATSSDAPLSFDEIDFGDDLTAVAIQQVNPEELKPNQEILFSPLAEARVKPEEATAEVVSDSTPVAVPQELPPLSIASRRKDGPLSRPMMALVAVAIVAVLGFVGYSMTSGDKEKVVQETGRILVRQVDANYIKNKAVGELLVISGEVVNEYNKPRASIQVKGMVYGADGKVIASKNAFCGNPLSPQQLSTMPLDKIEAAMANQFGDSLANMDVAPGKAVPFVIVLAKPDSAAKDYGVESAGSTVSAGKQ